MSTSHAIWQSLSQWNKFPITYYWTDVVLEFTVMLVTPSLSLNVIPDGRLERLKLIASLYRKGWKSVEIAKHLNERGILTPSGKMYYPKLVWVTHNKFSHRAIRQRLMDVKIHSITFTLLA